ncbi:MAG: hypothetical protein QM655_01010 [Nocardioidaceae bacterium]
MEVSLSWGIACLLDRLGDGHGRRVLIEATGVELSDVLLATELARKAWAVSVLVRDIGSVDSGLARTEEAGVVVDWVQAGAETEGFLARRFAFVVCIGTPGVAEDRCEELGRVLQADGLLLLALGRGGRVPSLRGLEGVSLAKGENVTLVSARRV